jgi:hypothetical protein
MKHLNAGDSPLYGRFAHTFRLEPFDYFDAAGFVPFMKHRERAITHGIFGGTPRFLSFIRPELARYDPLEVWKREIESRLDGYMGRVFERIVREAYHRHRQRFDLPMVDQWGLWEGTIVPGHGKGEPRSIEMDVVSRLTDRRMLTGAVK